MGCCIHLHSFTLHNLAAPSHLNAQWNKDPRCSMFQLYFMIYLTVSSFCSFIVILARSAHSGFVTYSCCYFIVFWAFRTYFCLLRCNKEGRSHMALTATPQQRLIITWGMLYTRLSAIVNWNTKPCFLKRRNRLRENRIRKG